jgi:MFS family permease
MTVETASRTSSGLSSAGLRRVLVVLCVTEITSWGVLYYAFPVLAPSITAAERWSATEITAAFSAGQLTMALVGIPVGRRLDRHGPRGVMTAGSLLAVPAVVAIATAPDLAWFVGAWMLAGVAMSGVLYVPAFAALTRWYGPRRVAALTVLTLVAGLASTVFAPLTAALAGPLDWRATYLVLAVVLAVLTIPTHWWGLRGPWPDAPTPHGDGHAPAAVVRSRAFLALGAAFTLTAFATFAVLVNLVPLLIERGIDRGVAAVALGLGGAGQVLGRLGYARIDRRFGVRARTVLVLVAVAITTALIGLLTSVVALIGAVIVAGMARGVFTLLHATAITDRWGTTHYGRLTGILSAPLTVTIALAPWAGAALAAALGGYPSMFLVLAGLTAAAAVLGLASTTSVSKDTSCTTSL